CTRDQDDYAYFYIHDYW
nr:immunoglobulin heavy chain junction region [Macaca mulatta]MOW77044.1 immunoglobulin heavy chain junction region [Macaca mulatta]MOW78360.1 immunoglobulin heavy chain junction region [Macaca mulatta]MOW79512.1 immunoglobulin heavy chain junction region [Macaca mulatta]MOW80451.1 immunoglobulin heavy chain junction region [Macaca mulatta]